MRCHPNYSLDCRPLGGGPRLKTRPPFPQNCPIAGRTSTLGIGSTGRRRTDQAGFAPPVGIAADSSGTDLKSPRLLADDLTTTAKGCNNYYMMASRKTYDSMTEAIREAIAESELSFKAIERESGVVRQSLMKFAAGKQSLRLDAADKLAKFFDIQVSRRKAK